MDGVGNNKKNVVEAYIKIVIGTGIMGLAIKCIYDPISLVTGGFTGVAILVKKLTEAFVAGGFPLWLTNLAFNIPVFHCCLGRKRKEIHWKNSRCYRFRFPHWLYVIPEIDLVNG